MVERRPEGSRYGLGWRVFELGIAAASRLDLLERAKPFVARLVDPTGETAHFGVLRQGEAGFAGERGQPLHGAHARHGGPAHPAALHVAGQGHPGVSAADEVASSWRAACSRCHAQHHRDRERVPGGTGAGARAAATRWTTRSSKRACAASPRRCGPYGRGGGSRGHRGPELSAISGSAPSQLSRVVKRWRPSFPELLDSTPSRPMIGYCEAYLNSRTASMDPPIEQSASRSTITSTRYGTRRIHRARECRRSLAASTTRSPLPPKASMNLTLSG